MKATDSGFGKTFNDAAKTVETFEKNSNSTMMAVGNASKDVGKSMTKGLTIPIVGIGVAAAKIGGDFEAQMSRVKAISGATGNEFDKLRDQAIDLGAKTAFSAKESAAGMENLASAGFAANEIMDAMPGLLDLAAVSGGDVAVASEYASSALRGFGLEASEAGHVADVFARAAADTNAEVVDMGYAMKYVAPVSKAMGISIEETAAAIGIMSDAGVKGSQAGTTLRGALSRLARPTKPMMELMKSLGISFYDTEGNMVSLEEQVRILEGAFVGMTQKQKNNALVTLYGQESLSGMLALINKGPDSLNKLTKSLVNSDGAADEMARTMQDNMKSSLEQMVGAFESAAIVIQQILAPVIRQVADSIASMVEKFVSAPEPIQKLVVAILALLAAIGPIVLVVGTILIWFSKLQLAISFISQTLAGMGTSIAAVAGAVFWWIAVIAAVVAAIVILWNTSETFRNVVTAIWNGIVDVITAVLTTIVDFVMEVWGMLVNWWDENNDQILRLTNSVWGAISGVIKYFVQLIGPIVQAAWTTIKNVTLTTFNLIKSIIKVVLNTVLSLLGIFIAAFNGDWAAVWQKTSDLFGDMWEGIKDIFVNALDVIVSIFSGFGNTLFESGKALVKMVADGIKSGIKWVTDAIGDVTSSIRNFLPFSPAKEGPLSDLDKLNFGGTISTGIYDGEKEVQKAMNSILTMPEVNKISGSNLFTALDENLPNTNLDDYALKINNQGNIGTTVKHKFENEGNQKPAIFNVRLGNQNFKAFVDDIANAQGQQIDLNMQF